MRISDWSSDVCSSDLERQRAQPAMVCELFLRQAADLAHAFDGLPEVQAAGIEVGVELVAQRTRVFEVTAPAWLGRHGRSPLTPASGVRSRARTPRRCPHRPPVRANDPPAGAKNEERSCRERVCQYV